MSSTRFARRLVPATVLALVVGLLGVPAGVAAAPPSVVGPVEVIAASSHAVSPPLRNMRPSAPSAATLRERRLLRAGGPVRGGGDGALQTSTTSSITTSTTSGLSFPGVGEGDYKFTDYYAPPDTNGAVGETQYVQWVNVNIAVFDKSTGTITPGFPKPGNAVWSSLGGPCATDNNGDPIVQYDQLANRWILTQFAVSSQPYYQCVAVSTSADATGSYNLYAFPFGSQFPDYPKLGVWPDAYYMSFNIFNNGSAWAGAKACALDRNAMLAGKAATMQCFQLSTSYPSLLPSDLDGMNPPPAGSPDFFLDYGSNSLRLWKFHVDWTTPSRSTFTGPTSISVASFSPACNGGTCIPQPGTSQQLDSLADRLMYRLAYRNLDGHESMVVDQSVATNSSSGSGIRWYELRNPQGSTMAAGTPVVYQQGTYAPDSNYRWMGSIAMDQAGDIAVGYSVSSSSMYPSIRYTGRVPSDQLGTLEAETIVKTGSGSQLQNLSRWGDYSSMSVDPVDGCTFWYTNEYLKTSGTWNWSTWITSFKFPGCGSPTNYSPSTSLSVVSAPTSALAGSQVAITVNEANTSSDGETLSNVNVVEGSSGAACTTWTAATSTTNGQSFIAGGSLAAGDSVDFTCTFTMPSSIAIWSALGEATDPNGKAAPSSGESQSGTVTLSAGTPDFSLAISPLSNTVSNGSAQYTVTVTSQNGFSGNVSLTLSGLPGSWTWSFSPSALTRSGSSTLTISPAPKPSGSRTFTVAGTSGTLTHSVTATIVN